MGELSNKNREEQADPIKPSLRTSERHTRRQQLAKSGVTRMERDKTREQKATIPRFLHLIKATVVSLDLPQCLD